MPLVASKVAVTGVELTLPALRKRNCNVTVSPGEIAPSAGSKLSAVKVEPAATMLTNGVATTVLTDALLSAGFGSASAAVTVAEEIAVPRLVLLTVTVIIVPAPLASEEIAVAMALPVTTGVPVVALAFTTLTPAGSV